MEKIEVWFCRKHRKTTCNTKNNTMLYELHNINCIGITQSNLYKKFLLQLLSLACVMLYFYY